MEGKRYYLIKWKGYSQDENSWEPLKNLSYVTDEVEAFERDNQSLIQGMEKKWKKMLDMGEVRKPIEED